MLTIAWSISAGAAAAAGTRAGGTISADGITTASATVDAGTDRALTLQLADVGRVALLIVTCDRYDGTVTLQGADAADPVLALTGPIMAFGDAAQRLTASLATVTIAAAAAPDAPATVGFFIATMLT